MDSAAIDKLESLLSRKKYQDLDAGEREFVLGQLGSADEYTAMYELTQHHKAKDAPVPDARILKSLQQRITDRRKERFSLQWLFRAKVPAPAFYLAVLGLLVALVIERPVDPPESITYLKTDTLFVASAPDTVFVEKVIYRARPVITTPSEVVVSSTPHQIETPVEGVSMRERQELEVLLESGS